MASRGDNHTDLFLLDPIKLGTAAPVNSPDATVSILLEAMPLCAVVIDSDRKIVAANRRMLQGFGPGVLQAIKGLRLGDALSCLRLKESPASCGEGQSCTYCGVLSTIEETLQGRKPVQRECRILLDPAQGGSLDLEVRATPMSGDEGALTVVTLRDISAEKRRRVLERIFFHDVLNTAGGISGIAGLLAESSDPTAEGELKALLLSLSSQLVEEINSQRQLMAAESGELQLSPCDVSVPQILSSVRSMCAGHPSAHGRTIVVSSAPDSRMTTDPTILRRILGNMVKNALEATAPGGEVTLWAELQGREVVFQVHNRGEIVNEVRHQLFQRSFSTKGEGRGIGTYSVKLLGERYLRGKVEFSTNPTVGTIFMLRLPLQWPDGRSEVQQAASQT